MNKSNYECYPNPDGTRGWVWNPITGSLGDCPNPNARKLANGRLKSRYLANKNTAYCPSNVSLAFNEHPDQDPFYPRFWEDRLYFDMGTGQQKGIFVCDMSDLFGIGIPDGWTARVLWQIQNRPNHRFYLLTKQPQNLIKWSPFPDNCRVGVTVTNEGVTYPDMMEEACRSLAEIKATVKYISFEPLLSSIYKLDLLKIWGINWVIIGAMTGTRYELLCYVDNHYGDGECELTLMPYGKKWTLQPKLEWVEDIVRACDKAGVPVFCKDNLLPLLYQLPQSCMAWTGYGEQTRRKLRQEMPECK